MDRGDHIRSGRTALPPLCGNRGAPGPAQGDPQGRQRAHPPPESVRDRRQEVPYEDVGRGHELAGAGVVPLSERDLERLPLPTRHQVNVLGFVPADDINPIRFAKPYFVAPDGETAQHAYTLLAAALTRSEAVAVCKVAIRTRERLAALRPRHSTLILHTLLWPDEIREPHGLAPTTPVTERELRLAVQLIGELAGVDTDELHDQYREALEQLIDAKTAGGQLEPPRTPQPTENLLAVLEESVRSARHGPGGGHRTS
ncbi:Ku protein [Streptomyces sp. NPDC059008]|uniref:non-homologous end joining protein Ku n=1 Tax=Streptomyces sp. NPDC059008 TaxID=3346693 RepID=UPI0036B212A8